jgi:4-amino-4-deoxy-L-arabinose transferase-like glycosyltransferase
MALLNGLRTMRDPKRFWVVLGGIAVIALVVRVTYVFAARDPLVLHGDNRVYHDVANFFANGDGFISPYFGNSKTNPFETAVNPPLYFLWIAIPSLFGLESALAPQLWWCLLGVGTIVLLGVLGRELVGPRAAWIAAGIGAIYPNLFYWDGVILSETMSMFTATLVVWLGYRYYKAPSTKKMLLLGGACGLAAMSRAELALLVPFVLIPLAVRTRDLSFKQQMQRLVAAGLVALVLIAPWVAYNFSRFEKPTFISNGLGVTLAATQCDPAYYGPLKGFWDTRCSAAVSAHQPSAKGAAKAAETSTKIEERKLQAKVAGTRKYYRECDAPAFNARGVKEWNAKDESERASVYLCVSREYLTDHVGRFPVVVALRLLRGAGLYNPGEMIRLDQFPEGRDKWIAQTGLVGFWILGLLAVAGVVILRRRKTPVYPLVSLVVIAFMTIAISFATPRYRTTAEPAVVMLAAIAFDAALARRRPSTDPSDTSPAQ